MLIQQSAGRFTKTALGLSSLVITLLISGCLFTSKSRVPDLSEITPEEILSRVRDNLKNLEAFEGRGRFSIDAPGEGHNGYMHLYFNTPDSVHLKIEAMLGIDVGALFIDQDYFAAYAPRENRLYYGERDAFDLRDLWHVALDTKEFYEAFTGLTQITLDGPSQLSFDKGKFLITIKLSDGTIKYWVDPSRYVVTTSHLLSKEGQIVLKKEFSRFRKRKNVHLPQTIKLTRPLARERITVFYTSQKTNKHIEAKKFHMKVSKNAKRIYWGNLDEQGIKLKL